MEPYRTGGTTAADVFVLPTQTSGLLPLPLLLLLLTPVAPADGADAEAEPPTHEGLPDPLAAADKDATARLYLTNAERREVGIKRHITSWLTASGLAEADGLAEGFDVRDTHTTEHKHETSVTLQLGLTATPIEFAKADVLWEYDTDRNKITTDEAMASLEQWDFELEAGRQYTPLGVYISHFPSGPILEFGETNGTGVSLSYGPDDGLDLKAMVYRGRARSTGTDASRIDWSAAVETWSGDSLSFGLSYQSDLADSDEKLLEDENNRFERKVPALSTYAVWTTPKFDLSFEALGALKSFRELDPDRNQPVAWNLEFSHVMHPRFDWALRWEGSLDVQDQPKHQVGVALTFRTGVQASLSIEYLHGWFKGELATNDEDEPYRRVNRVGAQLSLAF